MALSNKPNVSQPSTIQASTTQTLSAAQVFDLIKKGEFSKAQTYLINQPINQTDREGQTALMIASQLRFWSIPLLEWLYEHGHGFLIDLQDHKGFTALHHATRTGTVEAVKWLLEKSASLELKDSYGNTPLWRAINSSSWGKTKAMLLLAAGANPDSKNNYSHSPREQLKDTCVEDLLEEYNHQLTLNNSMVSRLSTELLQRKITFTVEDEYQSIRLQGFDPMGEPSIRIFNDGVIYVVIEFMPPWDFEMSTIHFNRFDSDMSRAIGVKVLWEDREFFRIEKPESDTILRLIDFIENYRWRHGYQHGYQ
ncbi:ankyrin repeat domain-containing protein [Cytophagaceae bacterium DM2B3-1]|uniref:Ankyrin repeat domain-containing protein n=1 Tax=Xanthocytophaga flava TaxID=3048013 RepID=A0ABT7CV93_9BACT|nr:ankyrin repeat domain-containing protein [Xanthocytophaga flavus]MDJ1497648.1 ankyrin repeat domain-containing protein [Xanthocytophaga flavus]